MQAPFKAWYSNSPHEEWSGKFINCGDNRYELQGGRYDWHGWGNNSSGTLNFEMAEIVSQE